VKIFVELRKQRDCEISPYAAHVCGTVLLTHLLERWRDSAIGSVDAGHADISTSRSIPTGRRRLKTVYKKEGDIIHAQCV